MKKTGKKFWLALVLFGLTGQVAWVVENMYLNVFIYKMFHASAADISMMVGASAVTAAVTTILMGALSDRIGKRKILICGGYITWGIAILGFGLVRMDILMPICGDVANAAAMGVTLVIALDCIMTFLGSTANDAAFNAWMTDAGDGSNRGAIEGINSMMPLLSILVVFGGFMGVNQDVPEGWTLIFTIVGGVVLALGISGFFLIDEIKSEKELKENSVSYLHNLVYSFRLSTIKKNRLLYAVIGAFALFNISIQVFMPYLILYYEKTLQMTNYVLIMAPAIIIAAIVTAVYGGFYDQLGFQMSVKPCMIMLIAGYVLFYFTTGTVPVFIASLLMMCGYLCGMAVFGAKIRSHIPEQMAGRFQGIRIIGQVLVPGVIGPAIGAYVLRNAAQIENSDGTFSFLPNRNIWLAAILAAAVVVIALRLISLMVRNGHYDLYTEAGESLAKGEQRWNMYPRPQMKRDGYMLLNDGWTIGGRSVRVPFPPQAALAEYDSKTGTQFTYEKSFSVPETFTKERVILHFGAVDQIAEVWVNDVFAGKHEDGYTAFSFDITESLKRNEENILRVKVTDTLSHDYPYGKQRKDRGGMWYTPVSGIWKDVWMENVSANYIRDIRITPDLEGIDIELNPAEGAGSLTGFKAIVSLENGEVQEETFTGANGRIQIKNPHLWDTKDPYLYEMKIMTESDEVATYFALRTIDIRTIDGINRVCLNGNPVFLHGVLDQGYFPDGIFLPAEPEEFERDVLRMKELGMNMIRKHIKVEPECFYYYCDKHGMLVIQDMVNNNDYSFIRDTALPTLGMKKRKDTGKGNAHRKQIFKEHTKNVLKQLYNHPCIVIYTIFNEGWGQFDSDEMYDYAKSLDPTRLYDSTSGWFAQMKNDFDSEHLYFNLVDLHVKERPLFVSETGGYTRVIEGHYFSKYNTYGYGGASGEEELTAMVEEMYRKMILPGIPEGVCGCVYTQLSDVEDEVNGLYTYDRKICKVNKEIMNTLAEEMENSLKQALKN